VGHHAAYLHDQSTCGKEEGRPRGICTGTDEDFAGIEAGFQGIEHNFHYALNYAGAREPCSVSSRCDAGKIGGTVTEHQAGDGLTPPFNLFACSTLADQFLPVARRPNRQRFQFPHREVEEVVGPVEDTLFDEFPPTFQERVARDSHDSSHGKLGAFAQTGQGAKAAGEKTHEPGPEPSFPSAGGRFGQARLRTGCLPLSFLEDAIGRHLLVSNREVAL